MLRIVLGVSFVAMLLWPREARAEWPPCHSKEVLADTLKDFEAAAKNPAKKLSDEDQEFVDCLPGLAAEALPDYQKFVKRAVTACGTILGRDPAHALCIDLAALAGTKSLGGVDIAKIIGGRKLDPWGAEPHTLMQLARLGMTASAPAIVSAWKANRAKGDAAEKAFDPSKPATRDAVEQWGTWRVEAAHALGALGGKDERDFLAEQVKLADQVVDDPTRSRQDPVRGREGLVRSESASAIEAIDKRLAKAAKPKKAK